MFEFEIGKRCLQSNSRSHLRPHEIEVLSRTRHFVTVAPVEDGEINMGQVLKVKVDEFHAAPLNNL